MKALVCAICGEGFEDRLYGFEHVLDHKVRDLMQVQIEGYGTAMAQINEAMAAFKSQGEGS